MDPLRARLPLIVAAAIAGALDITIKCPFDNVKTRLQGQATGTKASVVAMLLQSWRDGGLQALRIGVFKVACC